MKKCVRFIFFVIMISFVFTGCGSFEKIISNNISEKSEYVLIGEKDNMLINMTCGYREENYKTDGISNNLIQYGVIELFVKDNTSDNIDFTLYVGTQKYKGVFIKNPFNDGYIADVKKIIDKDSHIVIEINCDGEKQDIKLTPLSCIGSDSALNIFLNEYRKELKKCANDGKLNGEIFIKIIYDKDYYYFVNFVSISGGQLGLILSVNSGEIMAKNNTLK